MTLKKGTISYAEGGQVQALVGPSALFLMAFRTQLSMIISHLTEMGMRDDVTHTAEHDMQAFGRVGQEQQRFAYQ